MTAPNTGTAMRSPGLILTFNSTIGASAAPEGSLLTVDASKACSVALPGGASPTTPLLGLAFRDSSATANSPLQVVLSGVWPGVAGASITAGQELTSNGTDGTVKPVSGLAAGTNCAVIGTALTDANSGERVAIAIQPYVKQG